MLRFFLRRAWSLSVCLAVAGCPTEDPASKGDGGYQDIVIPEDSGGEPEIDGAVEDACIDSAMQPDAGMQDGGPSQNLCDFPETPPRLPPVSEGEQTCSLSSEAWPGCIADTCDGADFDTACRQLCEMTCERERWFCSRDHCDAPAAGGTYCETDEATDECAALCADDADCLRQACRDTRAFECGDLTCPEGEVSACDGLACDNSCATAFDGECDDGDPVNAAFSDCGAGSDCADCGARAACFPLGAECFATTQCCDFEGGDAWCANVGTREAPLGRCLQTCDAEADCPTGFTCAELGTGDSVCFPLCSFAP